MGSISRTLDDESLLNAEFGPDRGRLGSVNTTLKTPLSGGKSREPCLEVRSPALQERGRSDEHKSGLGPPTTGRSPQEAGSLTGPLLRLQENATGELSPACRLARRSSKDLLFLPDGIWVGLEGGGGVASGVASGVGVIPEREMGVASGERVDSMGAGEGERSDCCMLEGASMMKTSGEGWGEPRGVLDGDGLIGGSGAVLDGTTEGSGGAKEEDRRTPSTAEDGGVNCSGASEEKGEGLGLENTGVGKGVEVITRTDGVEVTRSDEVRPAEERLGVSWETAGVAATTGVVVTAGGGSKSTLTSSSTTMVVAELGSSAS